MLQNLLYCSCALSSPTSFVIVLIFICGRNCGDICKNLLMQHTDLPAVFLPAGDVLEVKASPADNHAALTGAGPSGGEDLHWQVRRFLERKGCVVFNEVNRVWIQKAPEENFVNFNWKHPQLSRVVTVLAKHLVCVIPSPLCLQRRGGVFSLAAAQYLCLVWSLCCSSFGGVCGTC